MRFIKAFIQAPKRVIEHWTKMAEFENQLRAVGLSQLDARRLIDECVEAAKTSPSSAERLIKRRIVEIVFGNGFNPHN